MTKSQKLTSSQRSWVAVSYIALLVAAAALMITTIFLTGDVPLWEILALLAFAIGSFVLARWL